ncbi:MAG: YigZ family protein, partial [Flavobacterium sp.]
LQKQHHAARHHCYAWQLGDRYEQYRVNDDGEPSNSAGAPIYGQIQAFELTNVLVVIVRYFGGTKLGVGGLIQAYKTAAKMALESSRIVKRTINQYFIIQCDYPEMNTVMRILKSEKIKITDQKMELNCTFRISVRERDAENVFQIFNDLHKVSIKRE